MKRKRRSSEQPRRNAASQNKWRAIQADVTQFCESAYAVCYVVGVRCARCLKSLVRFTRTLWRPLAKGLYRAWEWLLWRHCRRLAAEWRVLRGDMARVSERLYASNSGRLARCLVPLLALPLLVLRRHIYIFRTVFNVAAPVVALLLLVNTAMYWRQAEFALALEYQGQPFGYIADESVYTNAAAMVEGMVIDANESFQVERAPKLTLTVAKSADLLNEGEVRDLILEKVGASVTEVSGLYVDGIFRGAMEQGTLNALMKQVLSEYSIKDADKIDFFSKMELVEGLYPTSTVCTAEEMTAYLRTVPVKAIRYVTYTETIKYPTVVQELPNQPLGYQEVRVRGKNGKQTVTAEIISVDGVEQYRSVVSAVVTKAPVTQVVAVGGKTYSEDVTQGDGVATGTFVWPLPYTKVISSPFASRWGSFHGAIDISNGSTNGKPIIASDGGTVVEARYHSSYGYYVLIDHGNGYQTRYAHCSKLNVEEGQKVAQGEYIAKVGNTGYSFGAHLHFEVIKNGKLVDPLNYVKR